MEVLAVDRDSAHTGNCPHPLPPESEQVGDHDESCHDVKRSDHDERWHDEKPENDMFAIKKSPQ